MQYFLHGLLEAFPISSSMHLLFFGINIKNIGILHGITGLVTTIFFVRKIIHLLADLFYPGYYYNISRLLLLILIPKILVGFVIRGIDINVSPGLMSIIFGFLLFFIDRYSSKQLKISDLNLSISIMISLFSLFSFFPGASSLGTYYTAFRFFKINRKDSLDYAFILNILPSLGACILEFGNVEMNYVSILICMLSYLFSLIFCRKLIEYLYFIGIYRVVIGILICINTSKFHSYVFYLQDAIIMLKNKLI